MNNNEPNNLSSNDRTLDFKLYVMGEALKYKTALEDFRRICEELLLQKYTIEIINLLEHPKRADEYEVLATPTMVRWNPLPVKKIIGDLSDPRKVLGVLTDDLKLETG